MEKLHIFIRGFAMGCADVVPGVSGGTVALVTGIYDKLVEAIQSAVKGAMLLLKFKFSEAIQTVNFSLLIPLFVGIATALLTMAKVITFMLKSYPQETWSVFLGLMIGSVIIVSRMIETWNLYHISLIISNTIIAFLLTSHGVGEGGEGFLSYFSAGCVAIVAMILPGISGSFLLLIMGKYTQLLDALNDLSIGIKDMNYDRILAFIMVVIPFGLGCVVGISSFSWLLNHLLKHYRCMTLSILLGLMIGSLQKLWPYRTIYTYIHKGGDEVRVIYDKARLPYGIEENVIMVSTLVVASMILVLFIEKMSNREAAV